MEKTDQEKLAAINEALKAHDLDKSVNELLSQGLIDVMQHNAWIAKRKRFDQYVRAAMAGLPLQEYSLDDAGQLAIDTAIITIEKADTVLGLPMEPTRQNPATEPTQDVNAQLLGAMEKAADKLEAFSTLSASIREARDILHAAIDAATGGGSPMT